MYYKIASLVLNSGQKANSIADVFIAQPDAAKEALVGKLFILAEIDSQKTEAAKLLDFLINNINFNYYQNEKVVLRERIETISIDSIFESALSKTNKDLVEFLTREKIKISPYSFNLTVCVLHENELYFSLVGKNKNLLIYKEKTVQKIAGKGKALAEKMEYRISDIGQQKEGDNEGVTINKLFSEVLSGKIPLGGYFLVINEPLSEYLSSKQLIDIVTHLSPAGAVEQIRNLLEKINSYVSFLGIVVKNTVGTSLSGEELKKQIESEIKNWDYKPEIVATEERTEAIMTPAGTINLKHWLKILSERMRPPKKKAPAPPSPLGKKAGRIFLLKDKIFVKKRVSALSPKNILAFFARLASLIGKIVSGLLSRQKIATDDFASASPEKATKNKFWLSGRLAQVFLIVAVLSIAGLAINVSISKKRQEVATKTAAFAALLESIDKNQNKIESFLIYGNESEAKQIWDENKDLLAKLTEEEKKGRSDIATLFERQTKQLERLRKINMVLEQKKIADFSNLNKDASPENLILSGDRIYAASPKEKAVYKVDLKENMVTAAYNLGDIGEMNYPSTLDDGIFYLDKDAAIIIDKNDKAERIVVEGLPEKIGGAGIYNNRLYVVDKGNGQVRRYNRTEKGFSEQSEWLLAKTDLSSAVNVFIDGNIYILKSNGQAEKYLRGAKEEFSIKEVDEPISEATRLQIGEKHVYVIEPAKKRLVVFDEKGLLVGQYIFTSLESIKDVYVAEKTSQAYILSGQAIYQASIQQ